MAKQDITTVCMICGAEDNAPHSVGCVKNIEINNSMDNDENLDALEEIEKAFHSRYNNVIGPSQREAITAYFYDAFTAGEKQAYEHANIIREREINDILFEVKEEAEDTYGNGEKVIKKWMEKNSIEVNPLID